MFKNIVDPYALKMSRFLHKDFIGTDNITDARRKHAVTFGTPVDCVWAIHAAKDHQISLSFPEGGWKLKHPNDCHLNYIQVRLELHLTAESEMEFLNVYNII